MFGVNADGWLAVHHVAHREQMAQAKQRAERADRVATRKPAPVAPVVSTAPVCC